jgi:hypothetical protein
MNTDYHPFFTMVDCPVSLNVSFMNTRPRGSQPMSVILVRPQGEGACRIRSAVAHEPEK